MAKLKKVMLVDDETGLRDHLQDVLTEMGFRVTLAFDGLDSWTQMKGKVFDLLITDIDMPRLDGIELLRRMQKSRRKEKILVMTGRWLEVEDLSLEFPKVYGLLRKPFRISRFTETVTTILSSRNPVKQQAPEGASRSTWPANAL
jgi:two-component system sensor histidine kinase and response regulator WspE